MKTTSTPEAWIPSATDCLEIVTALVADRDDVARRSVVAELERRGVRVVQTANFADARASLSADLSLVIISTTLGGSGVVPQLLRAARRVAPLSEHIVLRDEAEILPKLQNCQLVSRPLTAAGIEAGLEAAAEMRRALHELTTLLVGRIGLKEAQRALRHSMSRAALARCDGSRRAAAQVLSIDRRYVQLLCAQGPQRDRKRRASSPPAAVTE